MDLSRAVTSWANAMRGRAWAWGECDCTTLVLSWLDVLTGGQHVTLARGRYCDEASARFHATTCGHSLESLARAAGATVIPAGFAQPGDIVLVQVEGEPWQRGHVCLGARVLSAVPDSGVVQAPLGLVPSPNLILRVPCRPRS